MASNDYSTIKPVNGTVNAAGADTSGRKRKKQSRKSHSTETSDQFLEEKLSHSIEDDLDPDNVTDDPEEHIIDYCA